MPAKRPTNFGWLIRIVEIAKFRRQSERSEQAEAEGPLGEMSGRRDSPPDEVASRPAVAVRGHAVPGRIDGLKLEQPYHYQGVHFQLQPFWNAMPAD